MGRHSHHEQSGAQFEDSHPGCMWGILHILDYHHWHQVRKMIPHKKHRRGRHTRCNGSPITILNDHDTGEVHECIESETDHLLVKQHSTKTSPTNKRSGKARIKALITKDMFKEENQKHLEPSEQQHFCDISPDWTKPIILLHNSADTSATRSQDPSLPKTPEELVACSRNCDVCGTRNAVDNLGHSHPAGKHEHLPEKCDEGTETSVNKDVLHHQLKEYADVLEIFKVNKELFIEILQDADVGIEKHFNGLQTSNGNKRFSKSRSFPVADSSRMRTVMPSTLKHKQDEVWSFPKVEKLLAGTKPPKLAATKSPKNSKNFNLQQTTLMADNNLGSATKQETSFVSLGLAQALNNQGRSQLLINIFKDIKRKIKHALKESKKDTNHSSKDEVPPGVPNDSRLSADTKEASESLKESTTGQDGIDVLRSCLETEVSDYDFSKSRLHNIRKSSSLNESLDKYTRLFEYSFGKETKGNRSKSLKLTNEEQVPLRRRTPRSFRRNFSMPDLDSFCSLLYEVSSDVLSSGKAVGTFVDHSTKTESDSHNDQNSSNIDVNTEKIQPPQALVETEFHKNKVERSGSSASIEYPAGLVGRNDEGIAEPHDFSEDIVGLKMMESSPHPEKEIDLMMNSSSEFAQTGLVSIPETCFPDSETNPAEFPISEGSELNCRCNHLDEPHCSVNLQNRTSTDSLLGFSSTANLETVENASKSVGNHFLHSELDEKDDADYNYVKNVLELSGFIGNEYLGTCNSLDQPLNPSLFEKLEACFPHELECSEEEVGVNCDHQLLFDLVNEAILDMYERSFSYFPKALSFSCRIRPMPIGHHFLQEVWARINWYLSSRPEVEQPFDYVVVQDLAKDDGWMNLQMETECVALELEELIFEELLDELICS